MALLPLMISQVPAPLMCFNSSAASVILVPFLSLYLFSSFHWVNYFSFPQRRATFSRTDRGSTGCGRRKRSTLVKVHNDSSCYGLVPVRSSGLLGTKNLLSGREQGVLGDEGKFSWWHTKVVITHTCKKGSELHTSGPLPVPILSETRVPHKEEK